MMFFICPSTGVGCKENPGYSISVHPTFIVQRGLCVTIPCNLTANSRNVLKNSRGSWLKGPSTPVQFVATNVKSRRVLKQNFHLTGNPDNGDCTLTITDARREDTGTYFFRVEDSNNSSVHFNFLDSLVSVNVTDLSDEPEISLVGNIVAGEEVTLNCISPGRCSGKTPLITWKGEVEKRGETKRYMKRNEDGTTEYHASLTFIPWNVHDQSELTCKVTFESNVTTSRSINLNVVGRPTCPACSSISVLFIIGMVVGNVVILALIIVGSCCFLIKHTKKKQAGNGLQDSKPSGEDTDSTYQDLIGQKDDIYYNLRIQR
ncbi:sialic acid-binding Ig-like lectin 13 [Eleutherodactylus coqui]|uniref:sialic acid-binding Ig-like lectin 13 n=1 Tax=Eleutherodactylus coqui TaxID=57060 RepID=UPI003461A8B7